MELVKFQGVILSQRLVRKVGEADPCGAVLESPEMKGIHSFLVHLQFVSNFLLLYHYWHPYVRTGKRLVL